VNCNPVPKPTRKDDGAFNVPPLNYCIKCGKWLPGGIERHHGIPKSRGGDHTWLNRFDLCPFCHQAAQEYRPGFLLADLEAAKKEAERWARLAAE
jgi:5-methylcytosine-specific restriction endonuclease McrA